MIPYISAWIVKWLLQSGVISENDVELYEYAVYSFLFGLMPVCLAIIIGAIFGHVVDSVLMIIPFMLIRKFSGGFHLKSASICFVSSTLLISIFLFVIQVVNTKIEIIAFNLAVITSTVQIFICSPINNDARTLTEKEYVVFKKTARIMAIVFLMLYAMLLILGQNAFSTPIGAGIILTALLQVPCLVTAKNESC